jgi:hypothetical protein
MFWTPCANCLDLMLEDIGKISLVRDYNHNHSFIYNQSLALNTMRKFTNNTKLVRHGVTEFIPYIEKMHKQRANTSKDMLRERGKLVFYLQNYVRIMLSMLLRLKGLLY